MNFHANIGIYLFKERCSRPSIQYYIVFLKALCIGRTNTRFKVNCLNFDDFYIEMTRKRLHKRLKNISD